MEEEAVVDELSPRGTPANLSNISNASLTQYIISDVLSPEQHRYEYRLNPVGFNDSREDIIPDSPTTHKSIQKKETDEKDTAGTLSQYPLDELAHNLSQDVVQEALFELSGHDDKDQVHSAVADVSNDFVSGRLSLQQYPICDSTDGTRLTSASEYASLTQFPLSSTEGGESHTDVSLSQHSISPIETFIPLPSRTANSSMESPLAKRSRLGVEDSHPYGDSHLTHSTQYSLTPGEIVKGHDRKLDRHSIGDSIAYTGKQPITSSTPNLPSTRSEPEVEAPPNEETNTLIESLVQGITVPGDTDRQDTTFSTTSGQVSEFRSDSSRGTSLSGRSDSGRDTRPSSGKSNSGRHGHSTLSSDDSKNTVIVGTDYKSDTNKGHSFEDESLKVTMTKAGVDDYMSEGERKRLLGDDMGGTTNVFTPLEETDQFIKNLALSPPIGEREVFVGRAAFENKGQTGITVSDLTEALKVTQDDEVNQLFEPKQTRLVPEGDDWTQREKLRSGSESSLKSNQSQASGRQSGGVSQTQSRSRSGSDSSEKYRRSLDPKLSGSHDDFTPLSEDRPSLGGHIDQSTASDKSVPSNDIIRGDHSQFSREDRPEVLEGRERGLSLGSQYLGSDAPDSRRSSDKNFSQPISTRTSLDTRGSMESLASVASKDSLSERIAVLLKEKEETQKDGGDIPQRINELGDPDNRGNESESKTEGPVVLSSSSDAENNSGSLIDDTKAKSILEGIRAESDGDTFIPDHLVPLVEGKGDEDSTHGEEEEDALGSTSSSTTIYKDLPKSLTSKPDVSMVDEGNERSLEQQTNDSATDSEGLSSDVKTILKRYGDGVSEADLHENAAAHRQVREETESEGFDTDEMVSRKIQKFFDAKIEEANKSNSLESRKSYPQDDPAKSMSLPMASVSSGSEDTLHTVVPRRSTPEKKPRKTSSGKQESDSDDLTRRVHSLLSDTRHLEDDRMSDRCSTISGVSASSANVNYSSLQRELDDIESSLMAIQNGDIPSSAVPSSKDSSFSKATESEADKRTSRNFSWDYGADVGVNEEGRFVSNRHEPAERNQNQNANKGKERSTPTEPKTNTSPITSTGSSVPGVDSRTTRYTQDSKHRDYNRYRSPVGQSYSPVRATTRTYSPTRTTRHVETYTPKSDKSYTPTTTTRHVETYTPKSEESSYKERYQPEPSGDKYQPTPSSDKYELSIELDITDTPYEPAVEVEHTSNREVENILSGDDSTMSLSQRIADIIERESPHRQAYSYLREAAEKEKIARELEQSRLDRSLQEYANSPLGAQNQSTSFHVSPFPKGPLSAAFGNARSLLSNQMNKVGYRDFDKSMEVTSPMKRYPSTKQSQSTFYEMDIQPSSTEVVSESDSTDGQSSNNNNATEYRSRVKEGQYDRNFNQSGNGGRSYEKSKLGEKYGRSSSTSPLRVKVCEEKLTTRAKSPVDKGLGKVYERKIVTKEQVRDDPTLDHRRPHCHDEPKPVDYRRSQALDSGYMSTMTSTNSLGYSGTGSEKNYYEKRPSSGPRTGDMASTLSKYAYIPPKTRSPERFNQPTPVPPVSPGSYTPAFQANRTPPGERAGDSSRYSGKPSSMRSPPTSRTYPATSSGREPCVSFTGIDSDHERDYSRRSHTSPGSLRPYKPPGSQELYYVENVDDCASVAPSSVAHSESTVESTHIGSDDAQCPHFPPGAFGSRTDPPSDTVGIYHKSGTSRKSFPPDPTHLDPIKEMPSFISDDGHKSPSEHENYDRCESDKYYGERRSTDIHRSERGSADIHSERSSAGIYHSDRGSADIHHSDRGSADIHHSVRGSADIHRDRVSADILRSERGSADIHHSERGSADIHRSVRGSADILHRDNIARESPSCYDKHPSKDYGKQYDATGTLDRHKSFERDSTKSYGTGRPQETAEKYDIHKSFDRDSRLSSVRPGEPRFQSTARDSSPLGRTGLGSIEGASYSSKRDTLSSTGRDYQRTGEQSYTSSVPKTAEERLYDPTRSCMTTEDNERRRFSEPKYESSLLTNTARIAGNRYSSTTPDPCLNKLDQQRPKEQRYSTSPKDPLPLDSAQLTSTLRDLKTGRDSKSYKFDDFKALKSYDDDKSGKNFEDKGGFITPNRYSPTIDLGTHTRDENQPERYSQHEIVRNDSGKTGQPELNKEPISTLSQTSTSKGSFGTPKRTFDATGPRYSDHEPIDTRFNTTDGESTDGIDYADGVRNLTPRAPPTAEQFDSFRPLRADREEDNFAPPKYTSGCTGFPREKNLPEKYVFQDGTTIDRCKPDVNENRSSQFSTLESDTSYGFTTDHDLKRQELESDIDACDRLRTSFKALPIRSRTPTFEPGHANRSSFISKSLDFEKSTSFNRSLSKSLDRVHDIEELDRIKDDLEKNKEMYKRQGSSGYSSIRRSTTDALQSDRIHDLLGRAERLSAGLGTSATDRYHSGTSNRSGTGVTDRYRSTSPILSRLETGVTDRYHTRSPDLSGFETGVTDTECTDNDRYRSPSTGGRSRTPSGVKYSSDPQGSPRLSRGSAVRFQNEIKYQACSEDRGSGTYRRESGNECRGTSRDRRYLSDVTENANLPFPERNEMVYNVRASIPAAALIDSESESKLAYKRQRLPRKEMTPLEEGLDCKHQNTQELWERYKRQSKNFNGSDTDTSDASIKKLSSLIQNPTKHLIQEQVLKQPNESSSRQAWEVPQDISGREERRGQKPRRERSTSGESCNNNIDSKKSSRRTSAEGKEAEDKRSSESVRELRKKRSKSGEAWDIEVDGKKGSKTSMGRQSTNGEKKEGEKKGSKETENTESQQRVRESKRESGASIQGGSRRTSNGNGGSDSDSDDGHRERKRRIPEDATSVGDETETTVSPETTATADPDTSSFVTPSPQQSKKKLYEKKEDTLHSIPEDHSIDTTGQTNFTNSTLGVSAGSGYSTSMSHQEKRLTKLQQKIRRQKEKYAKESKREQRRKEKIEKLENLLKSKGKLHTKRKETKDDYDISSSSQSTSTPSDSSTLTESSSSTTCMSDESTMVTRHETTRGSTSTDTNDSCECRILVKPQSKKTKAPIIQVKVTSPRKRKVHHVPEPTSMKLREVKYRDETRGRAKRKEEKKYSYRKQDSQQQVDIPSNKEHKENRLAAPKEKPVKEHRHKIKCVPMVSEGVQTTPSVTATNRIGPPTGRDDSVGVISVPLNQHKRISMFTPETPDMAVFKASLRQPITKAKQAALSWEIPPPEKQRFRKPLKENHSNHSGRFSSDRHGSDRHGSMCGWDCNCRSSDPMAKRQEDELSFILSNRDPSPEGDENHMSLQRAFLLKKQDFISRSRERQKHLALKAKERRVQEIHAEQRNELFANDKKRKNQNNMNIHPYSDNLFKPQKRHFTMKEMKEQTKRKYEHLPEVAQRIEEVKKRESGKTNRLKAEMFKQKILNHVLNRKSAWT